MGEFLMSNNGYDIERELVRYLNNNDCGAVRVAGSGGGGSVAPKCDVLCYLNNQLYCLEVKSSSKDVIYIKDKQIEDLKSVSRLFNAIPLVCIKYSYVPYIVISPEHMDRTDNNSYKITRKTSRYLSNNGYEIIQKLA